MPKRLVTLTTDFGLSDHFVGVMKGVIQSIAPGTDIVDITHGITPFEVTEAGFVIHEAYPYFPPRSVHVVVVDPGVGSARRPILVEAGGHVFIGPDNGVFSMIYARGPHKVREITNEKLWLDPVSSTFHGRDVFAPTAAYLAGGVAPSRAGKLIDNALRNDFHTPVRTSKRVWTGTIFKADRFGNLVTNFHHRDFPLSTRPFVMLVGLRNIDQIARNYAEMAAGEPYMIQGSSGFYEVSVHQASAQRLLGCGAGSPVELTLP